MFTPDATVHEYFDPWEHDDTWEEINGVPRFDREPGETEDLETNERSRIG